MAVAATTPSGATMGNINHIATATSVTATTEATLYPASNLLDPHRTKRWRSTTKASNQDIVFDLGQTREPIMLALVDCNIASGQTVTLTMATDSSISTSTESISLTTYAQAEPGRVLVWYFSGWNAAKQYVRVRLPANGTDDDYYEVGAIYLGTHNTFALSKGVKLQTVDPSVRSESYGGNVYLDAQTAYHTVDFDVELLSFSEAYAYKTLFDLGVTAHTVLDLHAFNRETFFTTPASVFYGFLANSGGFSMTITSPTENTISVSFEEARS